MSYNAWKLDKVGTAKLQALTSVDIHVLVPVDNDGAVPAYAMPEAFATDHMQCRCGLPTVYQGGNPRSFMSYTCPTCEYCYRNCVCFCG